MADAQTPVPGMCRVQIGCAVTVAWWAWEGAGKRCKWLIHKPLKPRILVCKPLVGGSSVSPPASPFFRP